MRYLLLLLVCSLQSHAQSPPKKTAILRSMARANDYFMAKWPDTGKEIVTNKTRPSHI